MRRSGASWAWRSTATCVPIGCDTKHKKRDDPARIAPFGSSLTSRRLLVAWLGAANTLRHPTDFVWISSTRLDGKPIRPLQLCVTRSGAMHSPSGSLLTPRVSCWTHWRSVDRPVPCAVVVPLDSKVRDTEGSQWVAPCVSFGRGPSDGLCLANRRDWTPRRLSSYLNPWFSTRQGRVMGCASCGSDDSCRTTRRYRSSRSRCNGVAQHVQADACNPDFMFSKMGTRTS